MISILELGIGARAYTIPMVVSTRNKMHNFIIAANFLAAHD